MRKVLLTVGILCLSLFIVASSFAAVPWRKFVYSQNWGGLNDNLSATEISDNEATDIQNVVFDTGGALKKRFGFATVPNTVLYKAATGTTVAVTGLAFYKQDNGTKHLVAISNNDAKCTAMVKTYPTGGGIPEGQWINIDNPNLPSSYSNDNFCDFAIAQNNLIFTTGVNTQKPFQWIGSGRVSNLTSDADCPNASIVEYHKNHLFLAGNNTYPSRTSFSALDDVTSYDATDFFDCETSDGSKVTALISAFDSLYIFKDKSIFRLSGNNRDNFILQKMVDGIGTLSNNSVKLVNNVIYFTTAQNDIAIYDGGYDVKFISQKIRQTIGNLNFQRATNTLGLAFSTYKYVDRDYYCSVSDSGSSTNSKILLFDTAYSAWTKLNNFTPNAWCVAENAVGQDILVFGDYSGYTHTYPSTSYYDGNVSTMPIAAFYQTKWFKYEDICLGDKYWRLLKTQALSESASVFLYAECKSDYEATGKIVEIDLSPSASQWDVSTWDVNTWGGASLIVGRNEIEKGKNMFQIKYYNNEVNQGFTLFGFLTFIEPTDRI